MNKATSAVIELEDERQYLGRRDGSAINNHSLRVYEYGGCRYTLDRTLDGVPPFYCLWAHPLSGEGISYPVMVNGQQYWGDGISWKKAEALAIEALQEDR